MNFPDNFDYGDFGDGPISDGSVQGSCSATLFGEHYIFGGRNEYQVFSPWKNTSQRLSIKVKS